MKFCVNIFYLFCIVTTSCPISPFSWKHNKKPAPVEKSTTIFRDTICSPDLKALDTNAKQFPLVRGKPKQHFDNNISNINMGNVENLKIPLDKQFFENDYSKPCTTYKYKNPSNKNSSFETRKFSTKGELTVCDRIFETFNSYYPALFNPFDYKNFDEIYFDKKEPFILVGNVKSSDPNTGKEFVEYSWSTKQQWLDYLKRLHDTLNRSFEVHTGVMTVFNDDLDPNRYWAIVRQNWKTNDSFGKTIYQNNGLLFVVFDFAADHVLKDFKIAFQLWFYEYQYDDIELGIKRYEKLEKDITTYFKNGIKPMSDGLKKEMYDYLIGQIHKGKGNVSVK